MKQKWERTFSYGKQTFIIEKKVKLKSAKNVMVFCLFFCLFVF